MAREKELFRDNLALLREQFGDVNMIPLRTASAYLNVCERTLKADKNFPIKRVCTKYCVPIVGLASWLS
jgi:hypothetical protein